jgi:hypothetical protein
MRIYLLMEVILAMALGLALARIGVADRGGLQVYSLSLELANEVLAGFAIVLGTVTWLEAARRGRRIAWGPGRRAWSALLAYLLLNNLFLMGRVVGYVSRHPSTGPLPARLVENLRQHHASGLLAPVVTGILALGLTHLLCRAAPEPEADSREWVLRGASALTLATFLGIEFLGMSTL